jgi:hypothetical protein
MRYQGSASQRSLPTELKVAELAGKDLHKASTVYLEGKL